MQQGPARFGSFAIKAHQVPLDIDEQIDFIFDAKISNNQRYLEYRDQILEKFSMK